MHRSPAPATSSVAGGLAVAGFDATAFAFAAYYTREGSCLQSDAVAQGAFGFTVAGLDPAALAKAAKYRPPVQPVIRIGRDH